MPGRFALKYEATGDLISLGDWVLIPVEGKPAMGFVRHVSHRTRKVEVWVPRAAVTVPQSRRRSIARRLVVPVPGPRLPVAPRNVPNGRKL